MAKIYYKPLNLPSLSEPPLILIADIDNSSDGTLSIITPKDEYSFVLVNGKKYKLLSGEAKIRLDKIQPGISDVIFIKGTRSIPASPMFYRDGSIERVPIDSGTVRLIEEILVSLTKKLLNAEEKILALEAKIVPENLFNFK